ncbi:hypothetical protein DFH09DRAFT_1071831 [Mycena vulgaris]|nr:hypothetical protein DFH09DRAFT_1071831 [Mycena vulgaris]
MERDSTQIRPKVHRTASHGQVSLLHTPLFYLTQPSKRGIYSCTSNGALRLVPTEEDEQPQILGSLPSRLCDWRLASDQATFAYGGDEVELSVWDTERALAPHQASPSDSEESSGNATHCLRVKYGGLRTYKMTVSHHLLTGTQFGDVRRYDTRARRPVSNWKGIGKMGGIKVMEKGHAEQSYEGACVGITAEWVEQDYRELSLSTSLDRYSRIHTSFSPPPEAGQSQDKKGQVIEKVFMTSVPTVVVWDGVASVSAAPELETEDDDVWDEMENVGDDTDGDGKGRKRRRNVE